LAKPPIRNLQPTNLNQSISDQFIEILANLAEDGICDEGGGGEGIGSLYGVQGVGSSSLLTLTREKTRLTEHVSLFLFPLVETEDIIHCHNNAPIGEKK
jgi:hypothetical protein